MHSWSYRQTFFLEVALKFTFLLLNNLNFKSNKIVDILANNFTIFFCTDLGFPFVANTKPHFIHIMLVVTRCRCRLRWFPRDTCTFFCEARSAVCQWAVTPECNHVSARPYSKETDLNLLLSSVLTEGDSVWVSTR